MSDLGRGKDFPHAATACAASYFQEICLSRDLVIDHISMIPDEFIFENFATLVA